MAPLVRTAQRLLATIGALFILTSGGLMQLTGHSTPCGALASLTDPLLPPAAVDVVNACMGEPGEAGLPGLVLEFGLAAAGQTREKMAKQVEARLRLGVRALLMDAGQTRCSIFLLEGALGREGAGARAVVQSAAVDAKASCKPSDSRRK